LKILATLNLQNGSVVPMFQTGLQPRDPCSVVEILCEQGCHRVNLVDVDAAGGQGHNRDLIAGLMRRFHRANPKICLQVGGGIRSSDQAQFFLDHGASWILVGTVIQRSPLVVDQLLARFRDHLTAGVDARCGEIQSSGWQEPAPLRPDSTGQRIRDHGFKRLLFTDIPADALAAPDFGTARIISQSAHSPLFMGGSITTREHLRQAMEVPGLQGVALDALRFVEDRDLFGSLNPAPI
jgi:phosphoribosylformimino-5-aminoimidazole carboxamide ribonucleotide (ProFAR) isomerase